MNTRTATHHLIRHRTHSPIVSPKRLAPSWIRLETTTIWKQSSNENENTTKQTNNKSVICVIFNENNAMVQLRDARSDRALRVSVSDGTTTERFRVIYTREDYEDFTKLDRVQFALRTVHFGGGRK